MNNVKTQKPLSDQRINLHENTYNFIAQYTFKSYGNFLKIKQTNLKNILRSLTNNQI